MWRFALLAPLLVAASPADPRAEKNNSTSTAVSLLSTSPLGPLGAKSTPSPIILTLSETEDASRTPSSTRLLSHGLSDLSSSHFPSSSSWLSSSTQPSVSSSKSTQGLSKTPTSSQLLTTVNSTSLRPSPSVTHLSKSINSGNSTRSSSSVRSSNVTTTGLCTGCAIHAQNPITTFFKHNDSSNPWTSLVVTATVVTSFITYNDTVLTQSRTVNQTKTLVLTDEDATITHHTPTFMITPSPGVILTVNAGPTYVIWQDIYGGLERSASATAASTCGVTPTKLKNWQPKRDEDWKFFIQTYSRNSTAPKNTNTAIPIPSEALQYLQNNLAIQSQFHGSNIATCTFHSTTLTMTGQPVFTLMPYPELPKPEFSTPRPNAPPPGPPARSTAPAQATPMPGPVFSATTGTFLSTTYATTVSHVTRAGCLRCHDTVPPPGPTPDEPKVSNKNLNEPEPTPNDGSITQPSGIPDGQSKPNDNANDPSKPDSSPKPNEQRPPGVPVVIGGSTYTVNPVKQTPQPDNPSEQNQASPAVVIGSQTLTSGQTATINGVPVVFPIATPGDSDPRIVVNGNTILIPNNAPTDTPVLTIGTNTITANSQGQFVVGTQTLKPGGPALIVDGSTLSLASSGGIAVVNGVTRTLQNAPVATPAPVITVGGRVVSATVSNGNTQFVIGTQTLVPGSAITVDGVTYSVPASNNGKVVVNGVTSTLDAGQGSVVIGQQYVTASIKDGTTSYVFSPSQTLTPGGVVTISGTTFSMPASASGSVLVINGITSTLRLNSPTTPLALTINGQTYTASVRSGTTEFVLGTGVTLRPGQSVVMSGTTYSLDERGTALVINGQTSSIPRMPASNSATTTASSSARSTTSARDVGNFIWSGIGGGGGGGSSSTGGGTSASARRFDKWVESLIMGAAGWLLLL